MDPKKAFKDRFLIDILVLRRMNCKVFQHQFNYHWNGQIKLQEPPKTPIEELNEWASYITRMFSKLLTKRNYQRCKGNTTLRLYEPPFIIAADASIQSVVNWCDNPGDCRLVYFDGGTDLHTIIYFGIKTTDLFIVVKPDEEIMASIDRSLKFWRRAGVPIKITLIHNENKIYLERKKYEEQFLNMAESYNNGYLYYDGQFKNLKKAKGKILGETYNDEDSDEEPGPMAQKVKPIAPKNNLQQPLPPQQPQQQQIIQHQEMLPISAQPQVRPPLEERLKELLQRIQQGAPSTSASNNNLQQQPSTSTQSTSRQSGSLLKNLGTLALIVLIICYLFGLTTQEVTRTRVRTPAGSKTVYKVRASPQMLQTYKEQHQEIDRFRRKNIINEIKNGEPCHFMTDFCQLSDNSSLIWESNCETRNCKSCFYEYLGRWEGDYSQANERIVWISNTKEIALSFNYEASREIACNGRAVRKSDQGFAIDEKEFIKMYTSRQKRSVDEEQLAAELTATEIALKEFYDKIMEEKCRQQIVRHDNPTYHVRQAFQKKALVATWLNEDTAEVFSCAPIDWSSIKFRPVDRCYKYIPVDVNLHNRTQVGFLDPELRILSESSLPADCERYRLRYLNIGPNQWIRVNTQTGLWDKVEQSKLHIFQDNVTAPDMSVSPIVFHEWVLRNTTEEPLFVHVSI
uniref:Uncharacterized protein n=1 Tax=Meloidogyne floridensis TaxID=298350 RepID=A0A915NIH5_9BILA